MTRKKWLATRKFLGELGTILSGMWMLGMIVSFVAESFLAVYILTFLLVVCLISITIGVILENKYLAKIERKK